MTEALLKAAYEVFADIHVRGFKDEADSVKTMMNQLEEHFAKEKDKHIICPQCHTDIIL